VKNYSSNISKAGITISVIMPVFNAEKTIFKAVESILSQTIKDIELIIIDDGSSDKSFQIISSFEDKRINLYRNKKNSGIVFCLNLGLSLAKGEYVARMDADDICMSDRFFYQLRFFKNNPEFMLVGSGADFIDDNEVKKRKVFMPLTYKKISSFALFGSPFIHPVTMFRSKLIKLGYRYSDSYDGAEDYKLWIDILKDYPVANLEYSLIKYRLSANGITKTEDRNHKKRYRVLSSIHKISLSRIGDFSDDEIRIFSCISSSIFYQDNFCKSIETSSIKNLRKRIMLLASKTDSLDQRYIKTLFDKKYFLFLFKNKKISFDYPYLHGLITVSVEWLILSLFSKRRL